MMPALRSTENTETLPLVRPDQGLGMLSFLVVCYAALLPYQFSIGTLLNFAPADCCLLLALLLAPGQLKYRKPAWTIWHLGLVLTFVAGSFLSVLRTGELSRYELLNKDFGLLLLLLGYAAVTSVVTDWGDLRHILRVFTLSVVFQNVLAVAAFLAGYLFGIATPFTAYEGLRLSGMLLDPNAYGGLLVVTLVICEGASWGPAPLFRGFPLFLCRLTLGLGILFTFSRSAWVGLGLALVLLCMVRSIVALRLLMAALIGGPFLLLLLGHRFLPFFEQMASRPEQVQDRFTLIHDAMEAFAQHPFLGGGLGSFRIAVGTVMHNSALWFLADFGLVGLAVFCGFLGWFFVKAWNAYRLAPDEEKPLALALLLAHTAMVGLAVGIEAFYQRQWWLVLGLIAASSGLVRRPARYLHPEHSGAFTAGESTI
jgi:putative inorganic carbon (hco3(-)) transporter